MTEDKVFYVKPDMILTSSAEDILRNRGYAIHYGVKPIDCIAKPCESQMDIRKEIEMILEKDYEIKNKEVMRTIVEHIVQRL